MIPHVLIGIGLLILVDSAAITLLLWIIKCKDIFSGELTPSKIFWYGLSIILAVTAVAASVAILISIVTVSIGLIAVYFPDVLK